MGYKDFEGFYAGQGEFQSDNSQKISLKASGETMNLPHESYIQDADIMRDGMDLVLNGPEGQITVEDYFAVETSPNLIAPNGATLTPELVNSFAKGAPQYAQSFSVTDESPIGEINEITGDAKITRLDGSSETLTIGTPVYQGDIIETNADAAVNVTFSDESSFAISEETRLAMDEYVFDPATEGGTQNFSVLKGVFVFTSGLIGRDDPDDVEIATPSGSIGIRGTIIAGDVNQGEITVVEGAIVLRDPFGAEMTLSNQFETGKFSASGQGIQNLGQLSANDVAQKFATVSKVAPTLFSSINDAANEGNSDPSQQDAPAEGKEAPTQQDNASENQAEAQEFDAEGAADQDGDNSVDGTVDEAQSSDEAAESGEASEDPALNDAASETTAETQTDAASKPAIGANQMAAQMNAMQQTIAANTTGTGLNANAATLGDAQNILGEAAAELGKKAALKATIKAKIAKILESTQNNEQIAPDAIDTTPVIVGVNKSPFLLDQTKVGVPDEYFSASATNHWSFRFEEAFGDPDFLTFANEDLDFELSDLTLDILTGNALTDNGIDLTTLLDTSLGTNGGWSFDRETGKLDLFFNNDTGTANQGWEQTALQNGETFNIQIVAIDNAGAQIMNNFEFELLGGVGGPKTITNGTPITLSTDEVYTTNQPLTTLTQIDGFNGTVFTGDGDDHLSIKGAANGIGLHTGNGNDVVTLELGTENNLIITGFGDDTIDLQGTGPTNVFSMQGDDTFILNPLQLGAFTSNTDIILDAGIGGHDKIFLNGTGNLDFNILDAGDHELTNFEIIKTNNSGAINEITLNYQDVIDITDGRNKLILDLDASDTLNFDHDDRGDNVVDGQETIGGETYDVYRFEGDVTLLVNQDAGTTNIANIA